MIHIWTRNIEDITKICDFLAQNFIHYKNKNSNIYVDVNGFILLHKFMRNNGIFCGLSAMGSVVLELMEMNKFDDIVYMHDHLIIKNNDLNQILFKACYNHSVVSISFLLSLDPNLKTKSAVNIVCSREGDNVDMIQALLEYDNKNEKTWLSGLPLSYAAEQGNFGIVQLLIEYGAKPKNNSDAVKLAIDYNFIKLARYLIDNGAKIESYDRRTFSFAMSNSESMVEMIDFFEEIVDKRGVSLLRKMDLDRALYQACKSGSVDTIKKLISSGADPNKNKILDFCRESRPDVFKFLSKFKANKKNSLRINQ